MPTLQEIAEIENAALLKNSISIANISDPELRGLLYDFAEEGSPYIDPKKEQEAPIYTETKPYKEK